MESRTIGTRSIETALYLYLIPTTKGIISFCDFPLNERRNAKPERTVIPQQQSLKIKLISKATLVFFFFFFLFFFFFFFFFFFLFFV
jgi:hypothetical protein